MFSGSEDIIAILDGQQRMTSLFIALTGTYASKLPYYRRSSEHAFPIRKLYLNLLARSEEVEVEYEFKFLSELDLAESHNKLWFKVSDILDFRDLGAVYGYCIANDLFDTSKFTKEQSTYTSETLANLFNAIHTNACISYYLEKGEELDKVLQIFIRINSGGTKLSYSDLLLSIATAQWKEKDAREEIHNFVDNINRIGEGFSFNKDFVLKSCLVLADFSDVKFSVDNFTVDNMSFIENEWDSISSAIRKCVELASKFGYTRDTLTSSNDLIPIAYYIKKMIIMILFCKANIGKKTGKISRSG